MKPQPRDRQGRFGQTSRTEMSPGISPQGRVPGPFFVFHKDIGFPRNLNPASFVFRASLSWSRHALEEADRDRYGRISVTDNINTDGWELVEIKINKSDRKLGRCLFRSPPDDRGRCTCLVIAPMERGKWKVITAWVNEENDHHTTLDRGRYDIP